MRGYLDAVYSQTFTFYILTNTPPPTYKKELQMFFGIMNYLVSSHKPLQKYATLCEDWHQWGKIGQGKVCTKSYIKKWMPSSSMMYAWSSTMKWSPIFKDRCIRCWIGGRTTTSRDGLWFLWDGVPDNIMLYPIAFASKILTSAETRYSNKVREALGIHYSLEKFCHYWRKAW